LKDSGIPRTPRGLPYSVLCSRKAGFPLLKAINRGAHETLDAFNEF
jgi:hypothetical protein